MDGNNLYTVFGCGFLRIGQVYIFPVAARLFSPFLLFISTVLIYYFSHCDLNFFDLQIILIYNWLKDIFLCVHCC